MPNFGKNVKKQSSHTLLVKCRMAVTLENGLAVLKKLDIYLGYDPVITYEDIYFREIKLQNLHIFI